MKRNPISKSSIRHYITLLSFSVLLMIGINGCFVQKNHSESESWIRINQLGYTPSGIKVAVWGSKEISKIESFALYDAQNDKEVFRSASGKNVGAYGPFSSSYRLDFSSFQGSGDYYLKAGTAKSPTFKIDNGVYKGTADFVLRYMRQQRSLYSDLAVYHDDFGDYSTNEPTMGGTASLVYLMAALEHSQLENSHQKVTEK